MARSRAVESSLGELCLVDRPRGGVPLCLGSRLTHPFAGRLSCSRTPKRAGKPAGGCLATSPENATAEVMELMEAIEGGKATAPEATNAAFAAVPDDVEVSNHSQQAPVGCTQDFELVSGLGKTPQEIAATMLDLAEYQRSVLATRIEPEVYAAVRKLTPGVKYHGGAKILTLDIPNEVPRYEQPRLPGSIAILTSDSTDLPVAEECRLVAEHLGCYTFKLGGVGSSSLQKLIDNKEALRAASVVIVVAGLDVALPSVVAGLTDAPVIAVPTSAGSQGSLGGISALVSNLSTSAPGITVVNVDNGIGAAVAAARMLKTADKIIDSKNKQAKMMTAVPETGGSSVIENGRNGNGSVNGAPAEGTIGKALQRKIGKPILGLLIFQTGALLPKLVPLGFGATAMLT